MKVAGRGGGTGGKKEEKKSFLENRRNWVVFGMLPKSHFWKITTCSIIRVKKYELVNCPLFEMNTYSAEKKIRDILRLLFTRYVVSLILDPLFEPMKKKIAKKERGEEFLLLYLATPIHSRFSGTAFAKIMWKIILLDQVFGLRIACFQIRTSYGHVLNSCWCSFYYQVAGDRAPFGGGGDIDQPIIVEICKE